MFGFIAVCIGIAIHPGVGCLILALWVIIGDAGERNAHERQWRAAREREYQRYLDDLEA